MARDPQAALVALNRFGFGARGSASGDFSRAASDPRGFIKADLARPGAALLEAPALKSSAELGREFFAFREELRKQRQAKAASLPPDDEKKPDIASTVETKPQAGMVEQPGVDMQVMPPPANTPPPPPLNIIQKTYRSEALARFQRATLEEVGFVERLVTFWSNHFCISANKGPPARIWAGAFEREAIRPHVMGKFADMLLAAEKHPAMLFFLDNQQSLGPNSRAGINRKRGLNENLAREIMELHTLGVAGGYTQADVTSLARIITGWTFVGPEGRLGEPGTFVFNPNAHEPGSHTLLGKAYPDGALAQGEAALHDLARHPSTAKFIATKLARHFVADTPPRALVERLAQRFTATDGDLKEVATALVESDEAWAAPLTKIRSPYETLMATGRLLGRVPQQPNAFLNGLNILGQPLWTPAGPNGFADTNDVWASPEGLKLRLDLVSQLSMRIGDSVEPRELVEVVAGSAVSQETRQAINRAESRQQALVLLLMSPEFQRR